MESSEDDEITIQLQHPRLATRTSDSVIINHSSSSDVNEENVQFLNWVNLINTAGPELRGEAI